MEGASEGSRRRFARAAVVVLLAIAGCAFIASRMAYETVDYSLDAGPAIAALVHLDPQRFFASEPQMGAFSLLLRWPFAALAPSGDELEAYKLGAFACLLAVAFAGMLLAREMRRRGRGPVPIGFVLGLWFLTPAALQAVNIGHPEELLGGALCVVAVLLAARPVASGVSLGLALATKQWALVAVPPTLLGSRHALRTGAIALAVWLPLELPLVIGNFEAYRRLGNYGVVVGFPSGAWWPLTGVLDPGTIHELARPLVLAVGLTVSVLAWRSGGARDVEGRLALLALVFLLRALLDPTGNHYFAVPFLMALLAHEGMTSDRPPFVSLAAAALLAITFHSIHLLGGPTATDAFYLAWSLPLLAWLWSATRHRRDALRFARRQTGQLSGTT